MNELNSGQNKNELFQKKISYSALSKYNFSVNKSQRKSSLIVKI